MHSTFTSNNSTYQVIPSILAVEFHAIKFIITKPQNKSVFITLMLHSHFGHTGVEQAY
jgi:hypothetical protein